MKTLIKLICLVVISLMTGCGTTILDKHNQMMESQKGRNYYTTVAPFDYYENKQTSYMSACFAASYHASERDANIYPYHQSWGGTNINELEKHSLEKCEEKFNKTCVVLMTNKSERCLATFEDAYDRAREKNAQKISIVEKQKVAEELKRAESIRSTCIALGFGLDTQELKTCTLEIYKSNSQIEAIRRASDSQIQAMNSVAEETAKLRQFQQSMELLRQGSRLIGGDFQQSRTTTNCRFDAVMKTISCN